MESEASVKTDSQNEMILITASMWENLQMDLAKLRRELNALEHASGVLRYDADIVDYEHGEDKKLLAEHGFKDVYKEIEERVFGSTEEKPIRIYEYMKEEQKKLPDKRVFLLTTKHVKNLFGTESGTSAIDWMENTSKMYVGKVIKMKENTGPHGRWIMFLTDDEIRNIRGERN
jgi:hypothetical protein